MSFLGAKTEVSRLKAIKNQYDFQTLILQAKRESIAAKMTGRQAECNYVKNKLDKWNNTSADKRAALADTKKGDAWYVNNGLSVSNTNATFETTTKVKGVTADFSLDSEYIKYQAEDNYIDTRIENLNSLLDLINPQIEATEKLEQAGVKDGSWWCVGGGS